MSALSVTAAPSGSGLRRVSWWLLLATLALLPYEYWLPQFPVGRFTVTTLEAVWAAALLAWLLSLSLERRLPRLSVAIVAGLAILLVAALASAVLATSYNVDAAVFVGRSATGWLLFMAAADQVAGHRELRSPLIAIVAGATLSALIGLALFASADLRLALHLREFTAAGAPRLDGTYDYPNTAAMAWEAAALLAVALAALEPRRRLAVLWLACAVIVSAAMSLTLSRGAVAGAALGILVVGALGFIVGRRRLGVGVMACAGVLVVASLLIQVTVAPVARLFTDAESGLYNATYRAPATATLNEGSATLTVEVANTGSLTWNDAGETDYSLAYHWLAPDTGEIVGDGAERIPLGTIAPGQSTTVRALVTGPDSASGYELGWDVVRGDWGWFSNRGVPMGITAIEIGKPGGQGSIGDHATIVPLAPPRTDLWQAALQMVSERPLLGVGPGTYRLRYGAYLGLSSWDERAFANNLYFELAATTGIVGLLAFLFVAGAALVPLTRALSGRWRPPDAALAGLSERQWLGLGAILAAAIAFLAHGLFDYFFAFNPINGLWWATLGIALAAPAVVEGWRGELPDAGIAESAHA